MPAAVHIHHLIGSRRPIAYCLLLLLIATHVTAVGKDAVENLCRRFSHQSTVIDDRLYIDGGYINYDDFPGNKDDNPNTVLGYHDLKNFDSGAEGRLNPTLHIDLEKNTTVPTVAGGILWPDSVNKRFYLYGGEWLSGSVEEFTLLGYDILYDQWDKYKSPKESLTWDPNITAYGAGVGVSETGMGYHYGGWISNKSMNGWTKDREMSSEFYSYNYDDDKFSSLGGPDKLPRAEGGMVWIPAGDPKGLLVYLGGLVGNLDDDETSPQTLDEIFIYDASNGRWYKQNATGMIPQNRGQFCLDVAWAPDKSSFNIYTWGGRALYPPLTNATSYAGVYILTMPAFIWVKVDPAPITTNFTGGAGRYGSSCNMVNNMSNMFIIGGYYPDESNVTCDDAAHDSWAVHGLWTGTANNAGDREFWGFQNKTTDTNVVPAAVYSRVGGDKNGHATLREPKDGFSSVNQALSVQFQREWVSPKRKATRNIHPGSKKLATGAIVGISIGSAVALALFLFVWHRIGKKVLQRREQKRQAEVAQQAQELHQAQQMDSVRQMHDAHQAQYSHHSYMGGSSVGTRSVVSPHLTGGHWDAGVGSGSVELHSPGSPPAELPTDHDNINKGHVNVVNDYANIVTDQEPPVSPGSPPRK